MCPALCRGGVSTGPGLSGEGAAHCDGGLPDGGEDGMEGGADRATGERQANPGPPQHAAHTAKHTRAAHTGHGERSADYIALIHTLSPLTDTYITFNPSVNPFHTRT